MSNFNFDARSEEPDAGRMGPVPAGWYALMAKKLEHAPTGSGDGEKISAQFEIVEGIHKGNMVFHNFNMKNPNEKAEKIGRGQFSALCHATRTLVIQNLTQLYSLPFKAKLKITIDPSGAYEPKNEITAFKDINDPAAVDVGGVAGSAGPKAVTPPGPVAPPAATGQAWNSTAAPAPQAAAPEPAMAPQPWAQPAAAPAPVAAAPVAAQPTPEQIAAWHAQQAAAQQAAGVVAAQQAAQMVLQQVAQTQAQPAWAGAPAFDPNAVVANTAAPVQGQTIAQPAGPAVAPLTPPWMTPAA